MHALEFTEFREFRGIFRSRSLPQIRLDPDFEASILHASQKNECSHLTLKSEQIASVRHVCEGRDVFAINIHHIVAIKIRMNNVITINIR